MSTINCKEKLDLLNKIEIDDWSSSQGEIEYISILDNDENRKILQNIGAEESDFEEMRREDGYLEIEMFAFKFADYFSSKDGFTINDNTMNINCDRCNASKYAGFSHLDNSVEYCLLLDKELESNEIGETVPCQECCGSFFKDDTW